MRSSQAGVDEAAPSDDWGWAVHSTEALPGQREGRTSVEQTSAMRLRLTTEGEQAVDAGVARVTPHHEIEVVRQSGQRHWRRVLGSIFLPDYRSSR
jgi:hypothetical protein